MNKFQFLLPSALALCLSGAYAQTERRALSIEEMFRLADENNRHIRAKTSAAAEAEADALTAKNDFLPSINASLSLAYNGDGTITDRNFSNAFTAPIPHFGNNFAIEVSQTVYAGGAIKNRAKIASLQSQIAELNVENSRQQIRLLIAGNFLELCKMHNQAAVFDSHIDQTQKMLDNMRKRHSEGVALQNDITRYELQLQSLTYSKIRLQNTMLVLNNRLTSALGLPQSLSILPDSAFHEIMTEEGGEYWQNAATASSATLQAAATAAEINAHREKLVRAELLPQIALFAADHLDGPVTIDIPAINKNFNYWAVGVGIKYNIGNLYKSGRKIRAAQLAMRKAAEEKDETEESVILAVREAHIRYREAFALLEVRNKSVELARRNYDIISYRYGNDTALITDLLDAAAQKLEAELHATNARIEIAYNYYMLKYTAGTL
ncbi:MAG: TolC family protein [Tannerellaceae bacterium]|jgi:outer membrane protein TolC|nr:TolC family protein [Tannerellaceae bacterium]